MITTKTMPAAACGLADRIALADGNAIPAVGAGVFQIPNEEVAAAVLEAVKAGYRLIDTAAVYQNETGTGEGIRAALAETGLSRDDLFVTSKVWNYNLGYDATVAAFERTMKRIGLDVLDLYLIHWPGQGDFREAWTALEDLKAAGRVRSIGVCNFHARHFDRLREFARTMPVLNQVERHPYLAQTELLERCTSEGVLFQSWSPLMQGVVLKDELVLELARKYGRTPAQIVLRWNLQSGAALVVRSTKPERLVENARVFDFALSDEDLARLSALDCGRRSGPDPDTFDMNIGFEEA